MNRIRPVVVAAGLALSTSPVVAGADQPAARTFLAVLGAQEEVPLCAMRLSAARGQALFHVVDEATGEVSYKLVAEQPARRHRRGPHPSGTGRVLPDPSFNRWR